MTKSKKDKIIDELFVKFHSSLVEKDILNTQHTYLLAMIAALAHNKGYCWAGNEYLAKKLNRSIKTVERYVAALVKAGFITRDIKKVVKDGEVITVRKLYIVSKYQYLFVNAKKVENEANKKAAITREMNHKIEVKQLEARIAELETKLKGVKYETDS